MSGPLNIYSLIKQFKRYQREIVRLIETYSVSADVDEGLDANELEGGYTANDLLQPALTLLAAHTSRLDNPHKESAESLGSTYSRAYVLEQISELLQPGILPISSWGFDKQIGSFQSHWDMGIDTGTAGNPNLIKIRCNSTFKGLLSGTPYVIGPQDVYINVVNVSASSRCHYAIDLVRDSDGEMRYVSRPVFDTDNGIGNPNLFLTTHPHRLTLFNVYVKGSTGATRVKRITHIKRGSSSNSWATDNISPVEIQPVMRVGQDYILTYSVDGSDVPRIPHTRGNWITKQDFPAELKP